MYRVAVFATGVLVMVCAAWFLIPRTSSLGSSTVLARIRVEKTGATQEEQQNYLAGEALIVASPSIVNKAISQDNLGALPSFKDKDVEMAIGNGLHVAPWNKSTRILELQFNARSESDAIAVLSSIMGVYVDRSTRLNDQGNTKTLRELIEKMAKECVLTLDIQRKQREQLIKDSPFAMLDDYKSVLDARASNIALRTRLLTTREGQAAALRSRANVLSKWIEDKNTDEVLSLFGLNDAQVAQAIGADSIVKELLPLFIQKKGLLRKVGRDHPDISKIDQKIAATREFLGKPPTANGETLWDFLQVYVSALNIETKVIDTELASLTKEFELAQAELRDYAHFAVRERQMRDAIETTKKQFDSLASKIETLNVTQPPIIEVVEKPKRKGAVENSRAIGVGLWVLMSVGFVTVLWSMQPKRRAVVAPDRAIIQIPDMRDSDDLFLSPADDDVQLVRAIRQVTSVLQLARLSENRTFVRIVDDSSSIGLALAADLAQRGFSVRLSACSDVDMTTALSRARAIAASKPWGAHLVFAEFTEEEPANEDFHFVLGVERSVSSSMDQTRLVELVVNRPFSEAVGENAILLQLAKPESENGKAA